MDPIKKNILVNAAMSNGQNYQKTQQMLKGLFSNSELQTIKKIMNQNIPVTYNTINLYF